MATYGFDEGHNKIPVYSTSEVYTKSEATAKTETGNLSNLRTSAKSSIVDALNEVFQNASNGKSKLATAIGDGATASMTWDQLASKALKMKIYIKGTDYTEKRTTEQSAGTKYYDTTVDIDLPFTPKIIIGIINDNNGYVADLEMSNKYYFLGQRGFGTSLSVNGKHVKLYTSSSATYKSTDRIIAIGNG